MDTTSVKEWVLKKVFNAVIVGGTTVTVENKEARIDKCKNCPYIGTVEPLKYFRLEGCTICGCPLSTKTAFKTLPRLYKGEPITVGELIQLRTHGFLDTNQIEYEEVECPHPDGNRWAEIDLHYQKLENDA